MSISSARVVATKDVALLLPPFNDDAADADAAVDWRKLGAGNPPSWPATMMVLGGRRGIAVTGGGGFLVLW